MAKANYKPDARGLRELGQSSGVRQAALDGARVVERFARADNPRGDYSTSPATVPSGWQNEPRSGARVVETRMAAGARKRTLARAAEQAR